MKPTTTPEAETTSTPDADATADADAVAEADADAEATSGADLQDADTVADATAVFQRVVIGEDRQIGFHIFKLLILSNCRATSFAKECHRDQNKRI